MSFGTAAIGTLPYGDGTGGSGIIYFDVSLVSPASNSTASSFYPTFTSLPNSSNGSVVQVEWQWDTDPSFANANNTRQIKTTVGNTSGANAATIPDAALYNGPFYWRVRAGDGTNWSDYTSGWSLNVLTVAMYSSAYAYNNTGLEPIPVPKDSTAIAYDNIGLAPGTRRTVIRPPQGWGTMPTGPQTVIILNEASNATAESYEYII